MRRIATLGVGIMGLGMMTAASSAQSTAPLLHWYSFDASATDSVGGVNGELAGNASIVDGALWTDGASGFVQFPQKIIPTSGSFTVALWFKTESIPLPNSIIELISQGCSGCPGFYIGRDHTGGTWRNFHDYHTPVGLAALFPEPGAWHHVAVSVDRSIGASTLWVDGASVATLPAAPMTDGGSATRLARQFDGYGEYHHGSIDDVRVYGGALAGDRIAALAASYPPVPGDCDASGMADSLEIATGRAFDGDGDGLLDTCESGIALPMLSDIVITQGSGGAALPWPVCAAWDTRTQPGEHLWDLWVSRSSPKGPWMNRASVPDGNPFSLDASLKEGVNHLHCRVNPNGCADPSFSANLWFSSDAEPTVSGTNGAPIAPFSGAIPGLVPGPGVNAAGTLRARIGGWEVRLLGLEVSAGSDLVGPVEFAPSGSDDLIATIVVEVVPPCLGDVSQNGVVDGVDLAAVLGAWGTDGHGQFECDIDLDGIVAGSDLALILGSWGPCP
jgi:Concanavalin A-like lectin/glucanases superfamily